MKKGLFFLVLSLLCSVGFAQLQVEPEWNKVLSDNPGTFKTQLISSSESSIKVNVQVPGFYTTMVKTPNGEAYVITVPKSVSTANAGEPDMPMTGIPIMIGDKAQMNVRVIDAQYMDFEGIEVAPSKGNFSRQIDPETVPYTYGECYKQDAFFPKKNLGMYEPYIIRDFRGQNMAVYPFAYNPVTKTLRVYYDMTVEMYKVNDKGSNIIESRRSNEVKMGQDFKSIYQRHFINYETAMAKYTALNEDGDLLIICYDNFISSMTDFVNWKKTRGINTTIVGTSTAGSSYTAIKNYIQSQYNANNNITHVLLVGDVAQIPGYSYSGGGSSYSGLGDNAYGQIVGSDYYNDVIIGRFSASTAARVTTQCNRVITYERDLTTSATWLQKAEGIAKKEGGSGHNDEDDYQHMDVIRTDLLNYGYSTVYQRYENLSGYTATASQISSDINGGVGIVNYCNHGAETMWGVASYSVSHVNALTNENKLPFIWSVACLVGKYDHSSDCFAEAWMNATNNSNPTGAIGTLMSYISQPWIPPMWAQDECIDILAGLSSSGGTKHTWGGVSINGLFGIFDNYGSDQSAVGTYQAWILYGDPSMLIRTKTPTAMTVSHTGSITLGSPSYVVNVTNGNGAVATITDASHNILGKATVSNGSATIALNSSNLTPGSELTLCVFGFDKVTYLGTIEVVGGTKYNITCNPVEHGTISAPTQAYANSTVTLTATPETGYCLSSWTVKKGNTNIPVTNNQFTMPEGDVTVSATFVQGLEVTLAPATNGTISADLAYALQGNTVNLTATPATGYVFDSWVVYKTGDASTTVNVNGNSFTMPNYNVTVVGIFLAPQGGEVTIGSGTTSGNYLPTGDYYKYSLTQQIYTASELGTAGTITAISFYYNTSTSSNPRSLLIYMSHTASSDITAWSTVTSSQCVFSGSVTFNQGWNTITLTTPFAYNGTSNVLLTVDDNTGTWTTNSQFYTYSTNANRAIYYRNDSTNPDPTGSVSVTANSLQVNAQMKITKEVPSTDGYLSVSPTSLTGFEATSGATASNPQSVAVIGSNLQANLTVTAPTGFEVCATSNGTYNSTMTLTPSNGSIRANVYVRLSSNVSPGYYSGDMTLASGTTSATVSLSGNVAAGSGNSYEITATANPTAGGTITGAGTYYENGTCTLVATANTGYNFTAWTKDGNVVSTNASYSFTVDETNAGAYEANFSINVYVVSATANPTVAGTISGTGNFYHGAQATLTATANEGYTFTNWTKNGVSVSTNPTYSFTVTEATTLVANFTINSYDITATANPAEGGYVTVGSRNRDDLVYDFEDGTQGWTVLKGNTGNSPNNWMHNTAYPTTNNDFTSGYGYNNSDGFMLSESYISGSSSGTGSAVTPDNYLISPQVRLGGSISFYAGARNTSYCAETFSVMVSTTGNTNTDSFTTLQTWTLSLSSAGYNATPYTVDLSAYSGMGYIAIRHWNCSDQWFLAVDNITIVEGADQSTGNGNFNYGETCVVTATPYDGYHFVNWTENGTAVSSEASYSFTVTGDRDLVANFSEALPTYYTIGVTANPTDGGTVTGADSYVEGSTATLTATANEGYTFANWTKNGTQVSTNATYSFQVTEDANYVANFTLNTYTITALVNPEDAGTVTGAGQYSHGATVTLIATANEGYSFVNWTENGTVYCTNATCVSTAAGDRTLVANFSLSTYAVTATADPAMGGSITGTGTYEHGSSATLTATPASGYHFINWTKDGVEIGTEETLTFTVTEAVNVVAHFESSTSQVVSLSSAFNWFSTYIDLDGAEGLATLKNALGDNCIQIKSQLHSLVYDEGAWYGDLNSYDITQMYQIKNTTDLDITLTGSIVNPTEHPINIVKGWNWIGYPVSQPMDVSVALADLNPSENDVIKSRKAFTTYIDNYGWWGNLTTLTPGEGYKYNSMANESTSFVYPASSRVDVRANITTEGNYWMPDDAYANTINVMAALPANSVVNASEQVEIGAFVNGECRGSAKLLYVEPLNQYIAFLTVYGNEDETVSFNIYNEGNQYNAEEQVVFVNDAVIGKASDPFMLHISGDNSLSLFPNPANKGERITVELNGNVDLNGATMQVYNTLGSLIRTEHFTQSTKTIEALQNSGIYTVKVTDAQGNVFVGKIVVK
ncbi:MAG: choice-of-anchor J domain-containing protein [Bacteroidales bacterium]|nr:choice-of-anchor J domain-containing protein [Bacteroidales bacterium]